MDRELIIIKFTRDKLPDFTLIIYLIVSHNFIIITHDFTHGGEYGVLNNQTIDEVSTVLFHF